MPRYVILRHELPPGGARGLHWDLMLEVGDVLRTWALDDEPIAPVETRAEALPDHRLAYLDYEGPVSGDRGHVTRWDAGHYREVSVTPYELEFVLSGQQGDYRVRLARTSDDHSWRVSLLVEPTRG